MKYYLLQREILVYMKFVGHQNLLKPYKLIRYYTDYIAANTYVIYKLQYLCSFDDQMIQNKAGW